MSFLPYLIRSKIVAGMTAGLRIIVILFSILLVISCDTEESQTGSRLPEVPEEVDLGTSFYCEINLNDRTDDTFKVKMFVSDLTDDNKIFQFPATVPGVYAIFDIGRFVTSFKVFDEELNELPVTHVSTNQWELGTPENVRIIEFEVRETFDTPVDEHAVYRMGGTSIEDDHVLLNTFDVLGYPAELKERDFFLKLIYPESWKIATSLQQTASGLYRAENYDKLVDSPILVGDISQASLLVDDVKVTVNAYSGNDIISAGQLLNDMEDVLDDARAFLKGIKVDRYNFIYLFFPQSSAGALEHSYSSVYVMIETPYSATYRSSIRDIAAHEFFHTVTPLHIHSEIIEDFNFAVPTASRHLWLYEGVTEWASLMMQYRNGSKSLVRLLAHVKEKKDFADTRNLSLVQVSVTSYDPAAGGAEYGNVYRKGALVAALLDIRLLELSDGTRGLRELMLELVNTYGPENAFPEDTFFDVLVAMTYPEIEDFIELYIRGTAPLPMAEYFDKIGIAFNPADNTLTELPAKTAAQQFLFNKWSVNL